MVCASHTEGTLIMPDKQQEGLGDVHKSGVLPRVEIERRLLRRDPPAPTTLPEVPDHDGSTGVMRVISEGEDPSAERDDDTAAGA